MTSTGKIRQLDSRQASRVSLTAPIDARIAFLQRDYRHIIEQPEHLIKLLQGLRQRYSTATFDLWESTIKAGDWRGFVHNLLETHYDPAYARSSASRPLIEIQTLGATTLDHCCRAHHSAARCGLVRGSWQGEQHRDQAVLHFRACEQSVQC